MRLPLQNLAQGSIILLLYGCHSSRENFPVHSFFKTFTAVSHLCQNAKLKNGRSPASFGKKTVWKAIMIYKTGVRNSAWFIVKNIKGESNDLGQFEEVGLFRK